MKKLIYIFLMLAMSGKASAQDNNNTNWYAIAMDEDLKIASSALMGLDYTPYLAVDFWQNIAIMPSDKALQTYIDPLSYAASTPQIWAFVYDESVMYSRNPVVDIYNYEVGADGNPVTSGTKLAQLTNGMSNNVIKNRLQFLLDNSIIMEGYRPDKHYYKTRGNSFVRIEQRGDHYLVSGSQYGIPVKATAQETENGILLVVDDPVLPNRKNVAATLAEHPEFSEFFDILQACGAINPRNSKDSWLAADQQYGNLFNLKQGGTVGAEDVEPKSYKATYLLDGYHYTIYAPTNEAMQQAYAAGLPTLADLDAAYEQDDAAYEQGLTSTKAAEIREVMLNFVKYHIQDNAVFVDDGSLSGRYPTAKNRYMEVTEYDSESGQMVATGKYRVAHPYSLTVQTGSAGMTVTDSKGNTRRVDAASGLFNLMTNEYWMDGTTVRNPYQMTINNSSFAVIHAIDGPLLYSDNQFTYEQIPLTSE